MWLILDIISPIIRLLFAGMSNSLPFAMDFSGSSGSDLALPPLHCGGEMARDFCKIPPWLEFTLLGPNLDLLDWKQTAE